MTANSLAEDILLPTDVCSHVQCVLSKSISIFAKTVVESVWCSAHALPKSERSPAASLTALHEGWRLLQQIGILHLSRFGQSQLQQIQKHTNCLLSLCSVWCLFLVDEVVDLIKELLCSTEDVFELCQLQKILLQGFLVGIDFFQFILQLLKGGLQVIMANCKWLDL